MSSPKGSPNKLLPALGFLVFAGGVAAWTMWPRNTAADRPAAPPEPVPLPTENEPGEAKAGIDLLAWFGSYDGKTAVPDAFVYTPPPRPDREPERAGEGPREGPREGPPVPWGARRPEGVAPAGGTPTAGARSATGTGSAPAPAKPGGEPVALSQDGRPMHQVSLVLITAGVSRAVVDGRVLGVGDALLAGRITRIVADGVHVDSGKDRLFFRLGEAASDGTSAVPAAPPAGNK